MSRKVDDGLNHILLALDCLAEMALDQKEWRDVAAGEIKLRQVLARTELILQFIAAQRPPPGTVQRMNS